MIQPVVKVALQRADVAALLKADPELAAAPVVRALLLRPEVLATAVLRRFQDGAVVWQQGDEGQSLGLVMKGQAQLAARRDTDRADLGAAVKGDVVGESEVLNNAPQRSLSVIARGPVEVLEVPRDALLLHGAVPGPLAKELERVQAARARALDDMSDFLNRW